MQVLLLSFVAGTALGQSQRTQMIDGELFRDPTQPPVVAGALSVVTDLVEVGGASLTLNRTDYVVSFIRTGGSQPVVVINNTTLTIGDEIEGARVVDIRSGEVVLAAQNQEFVLTTFSRPVREPLQ
ncbi:hypothetical protein [Pseudohongiella spirulinae]|nr:hypothetical protein [Pseudohongiella spirulinae]